MSEFTRDNFKLVAASDQCPSMMDLAAYGERRMSEEESERIEAHLVTCAACFDLVQSVLQGEAQFPDAAAPIISTQVLERAMALVRETSLPRQQTRLWMIHARRAAAMAASIAIGFAGYKVGFAMNSSSANVAMTSEDDYSFGLFDSASWDDSAIDLLELPVSGTLGEEASS